MPARGSGEISERLGLEEAQHAAREEPQGAMHNELRPIRPLLDKRGAAACAGMPDAMLHPADGSRTPSAKTTPRRSALRRASSQPACERTNCSAL